MFVSGKGLFIFCICALKSFVSGAVYTIGMLAEDIRARTGFSQFQMNLLISGSVPLGNVTSLAAAPLLNRFGFGPLLTFGAMAIPIGYGVVWAQFTDKMAHSFPLMYLAMGAVSVGIAYCDIAGIRAVVSVSKREHRGTVIGIIFCMVGSSSIVLSSIYRYLLGLNPEHFLMFLIILFSVVYSLGALFIRPLPEQSDETLAVEGDAQGVGGELEDIKAAIPSMSGSRTTNEMSFSSSFAAASGAEEALLPTAEIQAYRLADMKMRGEDLTEQLISQRAVPKIDFTQAELENEYPTVLSILKEKAYIALFFGKICLVAATIPLVHNTSFIINAVSYNNVHPDAPAPSYVSELIPSFAASAVLFISFGGTLGRFFPGMTSDKLKLNPNYHTTRAFFLWLNAVLTTVATINTTFILPEVVAYSNSQNDRGELTRIAGYTFFSLMLHGCALGWMFSLIATYCSERYPTKHYAAIMSVNNVAAAAGGLLGAMIFGSAADSASKEHTHKNAKVCGATECFTSATQYTLMLAIIALMLTTFLWMDARRRANKAIRIADAAAAENHNTDLALAIEQETAKV